MIQYQVEHQPAVGADRVHIIPGAEVRINLSVVDHREAIVGGVRKARQEVDRVDQPTADPNRCRNLCKRLQRIQLRPLLNLITVGNQHHVALVERLRSLVVSRKRLDRSIRAGSGRIERAGSLSGDLSP